MTSRNIQPIFGAVHDFRVSLRGPNPEGQFDLCRTQDGTRILKCSLRNISTLVDINTDTRAELGVAEDSCRRLGRHYRQLLDENEALKARILALEAAEIETEGVMAELLSNADDLREDLDEEHASPAEKNVGRPKKKVVDEPEDNLIATLTAKANATPASVAPVSEPARQEAVATPVVEVVGKSGKKYLEQEGFLFDPQTKDCAGWNKKQRRGEVVGKSGKKYSLHGCFLFDPQTKDCVGWWNKKTGEIEPSR